MTSPYESTRSFRFVHGGASLVFGLIAAATAVVSAVLIFGPLADQKVMVMSGTSSRTDPAVAAATTPLRVATADKQAAR